MLCFRVKRGVGTPLPFSERPAGPSEPGPPPGDPEGCWELTARATVQAEPQTRCAAAVPRVPCCSDLHGLWQVAVP